MARLSAQSLHQRWVTRPLWLALALLGGQAGLWAVSGPRAASPVVFTVQLALGMAMLAFLIAAYMAARFGPPLARPAVAVGPDMTRTRARRDGYPRLILGTTLLAYALIVTGALVAGLSADTVCRGFPLCEGAQGALGVLQTGHRLMTVLTSVLLVGVLAQTYRTQRGPALRLMAWAVVLLFGVQSLFGLGNVFFDLATSVRLLHLACSALAWGSLVALTMLAYATPQPRRVAVARADGETAGGRGAVIRLYITLAKPRIIVLLLVTTWAAMYIATPTAPPLGLVLWTMLGGALAAGGANAINMYLDRDIDVLMGRTARRPLPSHKLDPRHALVYGVTLGVLSFVVLTVFVNLLSAVLALAGLLFYVFIYTRLLKRTTTQNIVIGGAAGAIPPMVGWAAATGQLSLAALWLFIIVFYWTPPHFWALALVRKTDYARAGVPMLPVVMGDAEARKQILLYSVLMVALSVLLVPLHVMGLVYLALALGMGGVFIWYAVGLVRDGTHAAAWKLYKYSLLYLALLFAAMVIDHALAGSLPSSVVALLWP